MEDEYTFRYSLEGGETPYFKSLAEFFKLQIENILSIVRLTEKGKELKPDGFKLAQNEQAIYRLFTEIGPDNSDRPLISNVSLYEPRIEFIKKQLSCLLSVIEPEYDGKVVKLDGFRLKRLIDWLTNSAAPSDIISSLGTRCNCDCVFCCNRGNPPGFPLMRPSRSSEEETQEIKTRLFYFSPQKRSALFPSLGCEYEVTIHPYFWKTIQELRAKSNVPLRITTNGTQLTSSFVASLAYYKPLYIYLSLNSSSPSRRLSLMNDPNPEVAINSVNWLREHNIPFATVIVAWPTNSIKEMLDDLAKTVHYADINLSHLVQVNLPGHSRFFSPYHLFNREEVWSAVVSKVRELRPLTNCTIVIMPSLYEENVYEKRKNLPQIIGVVRNSPAKLAGLKSGDLLLNLNGIPVSSRPQARDLLYLLQQDPKKQICFTVQRNDRVIELEINQDQYSYPYSPGLDKYIGIIFNGSGLRPSYLERLKEIIEFYSAKLVLFLSSILVKPTFEQMLTESPLFGDVSIEVIVPENRFFGGNICMGDLLTVQDFIDCIQDYIKRATRLPDLIIIPSSPFQLSGWNRDLNGHPYWEIERAVQIPVALLPCDTIYE